MALLKVIHFPDSRLRRVAQPVTEFGPSVQQLARDMAETMYAANGVGLAAVQVGVTRRVVVIDISASRDELLVLVNPRLVSAVGSQESDEGCLSVPEVYEPVVRAEKVVCQYQSPDGGEHTIEADGLLAVCLQHEIDHLDGRLFVDHLSRLKRERIRKKCLKRERQRVEAGQAA